MKRHGWLAILAGFILAVVLLCPARAEDQLPEEIRDSLGGMKIVRTAHWDGLESTWFVLVRTPDGENMLVCFVREDGSWVRSFYTAAAIPQGEDAVEYLVVSDHMVSFQDGRTRVITGPILVMPEKSGSRTSYLLNGSGQWELFNVFWYDEQVTLEFSDGSVEFRSPVDQDHERVITVQGSFERDLRKVVYTEIPRSPQQAEQAPAVDPASPE